MQYLRLLILNFLLLSSFSLSAIEAINYDKLPFTPALKKKLFKNHTILNSDVDTLKDSKQEFHFKMAALHPKSCQIALRKLSRYETFHQYIDFIENSSYDEKNKKVYFRLTSVLLPFNMVLQFKFDRISTPGLYPFEFNHGFLKGLQGNVHISQKKNRCLFYVKADWKGPDSHIPDLVFEFFTKALSKILVEKMFSISRF